MVLDWFCVGEEETRSSIGQSSCYRCLSCGDIVDEQILAARLSQVEKEKNTSSN